MKFSNGEVFLFLHLVEVGGHPGTAPCPPPVVPAPPASILYVSNSVAPDLDELTHNVSCGVEFLFLLLVEVSVLMVEAGWNGHGGLLQNQICQILLNRQVLFKRFFVKFLSLILWEMQSDQRRPMVLQSFCSCSASCRHSILSKFPHQQASSHHACFFRTVTSF